ncbi:MAG: hypothetical protein L0Z62_03390 [Gemmataceae bacterium]|nr:hypothetical protein [Gemmataceae bacterium]
MTSASAYRSGSGWFITVCSYLLTPTSKAYFFALAGSWARTNVRPTAMTAGTTSQ